MSSNYRTSATVEQLFAALNGAQSVMAGARKDQENPHLRSKYADLASVWEAAREPLTSHGLAVIQIPSSSGSGVTVTTVLSHKSGEWIEGELTLTPEKATPQGVGSAITYARRYALSAFLGIAPEDDDGNEAEGRNNRGSKQAAASVAERKLASVPNTAATEARAEAKATMTLPKEPTTKNFSFLEVCQGFKQAIGEPFYYRILQQAGFDKSSHVLLDKDQQAVIKAFGAAKKMVDAAGHGEIGPKVTEGFWELFPDGARAAVIIELRHKLNAACGGQDLGVEEFEAARKESKTQWELVERLKTKVEWFAKQSGGAA